MDCEGLDNMGRLNRRSPRRLTVGMVDQRGLGSLWPAGRLDYTLSWRALWAPRTSLSEALSDPLSNSGTCRIFVAAGKQRRLMRYLP